MCSLLASLVEYSTLHLLHRILPASLPVPVVGLSCCCWKCDGCLEPTTLQLVAVSPDPDPLPAPPLEPKAPIAIMSMLVLRRRPFSTATLEDAGEAEEGGGVEDGCDDLLLPVPALSTVFKSLDSTLNELPVESLVMVTDPPPPDEHGGTEVDSALEAVVGREADIELGDVCFREAAKSLVTLLDDEEELEEYFTGEIVTLLLSFLCGELEPNRRPSSSSTLSNVDESMLDLEETAGSCCCCCSASILLSSLVLKPLAVRLLRSTKSLGFSNIRWESVKLGRGFLAFGSSTDSTSDVVVVTAAIVAGAVVVLNSPPLDG